MVQAAILLNFTRPAYMGIPKQSTSTIYVLWFCHDYWVPDCRALLAKPVHRSGSGRCWVRDERKRDRYLTSFAPTSSVIYKNQILTQPNISLARIIRVMHGLLRYYLSSIYIYIYIILANTCSAHLVNDC